MMTNMASPCAGMCKHDSRDSLTSSVGASKASLKCLDMNDYNKAACSAYFEAYKGTSRNDMLFDSKSNERRM